jgi:hypothetical protein
MERQLSAMRDYLGVNPQSPLNKASDEQLAAILKMSRGYHTLAEVDDKASFFLIGDDEISYDRASIEKVLLKNDRAGLQALTAVRGVLDGPRRLVRLRTDRARRQGLLRLDRPRPRQGRPAHPRRHQRHRHQSADLRQPRPARQRNHGSAD